MVRFCKIFVIAGLILSSFTTCKKAAGPGGFAQISGKVKVLDYTTNPDTLFNLGYVFQDEYYIVGKAVYLKYDEEPGVGQSTRTSFDGTYTFEDLRTGKYKVVVYSRSIDTLTDKNLKYDVFVIKEIEITKRKEQVIVEEILVLE